jgi:alpha-galactosidase
MSEYVPWYQHEPEKMKPFQKITKGVKAKRQAWFEDMGVKVEQADSIQLVRSHEYASAIMEALHTGVPMRFNGNVMNTGLIANLPQGCCVEVQVLARRRDLQSVHVGALPSQCAALSSINAQVEDMAVEGALTGDPEIIYHAICYDPLTAAVLSLDEIKRMVRAMFRKNRDHLPQFKSIDF